MHILKEELSTVWSAFIIPFARISWKMRNFVEVKLALVVFGRVLKCSNANYLLEVCPQCLRARNI